MGPESRLWALAPWHASLPFFVNHVSPGKVHSKWKGYSFVPNSVFYSSSLQTIVLCMPGMASLTQTGLTIPLGCCHFHTATPPQTMLHRAVSTKKSGCKACLGDRIRKWLAGAKFRGDWWYEMQLRSGTVSSIHPGNIFKCAPYPAHRPGYKKGCYISLHVVPVLQMEHTFSHIMVGPFLLLKFCYIAKLAVNMLGSISFFWTHTFKNEIWIRPKES